MPLLSFVAACVQRYKTTLSLQCNGSELSNSSAVASRNLGCRRDSYLSADPIPHERLPPVSATLWCQAFILAGGASAVPPLHLRVFVPQKLRRLLTIVTHSCTAGCRSRPRPYGKLRITMCASAQIATGPGLSASPCVNTAPDCSAVCDQEPGNIEGTCSASTPIGQYLRWAMLLQSLSICRSEFKVCKLRISPDVALACRSFPVAKCPEANNMLLYK